MPCYKYRCLDERQKKFFFLDSILLSSSLSYHQPYSLLLLLFSLLYIYFLYFTKKYGHYSYFTQRIVWKVQRWKKEKLATASTFSTLYWFVTQSYTHSVEQTQYNCIVGTWSFLFWSCFYSPFIIVVITTLPLVLVVEPKPSTSYLTQSFIQYFAICLHTQGSHSSMLYDRKYRLRSLFPLLLKKSRINVDTLFAFKLQIL